MTDNEYIISTSQMVRSVVDKLPLVEGRDYFFNVFIDNFKRRIDLFFPRDKFAVIVDQFMLGNEVGLDEFGIKTSLISDISEANILSEIEKNVKIEKYVNFEKNTNKVDLLRALRDSYKDCTACPLSKTRDKLVFGSRSNVFNRCDILFIGEAPGPDENISGIPFSGRSGRLLRRELISAGITSNYAVTNSVCCFPGRVDGKIRQPDTDELRLCRPRLFDMLEVLRPRLVVPIGAISLLSVAEKQSITKYRGKYFYKLFRNKKRDIMLYVSMFPIFHPAYILRNMGKLEVFRNDLKQISKIVVAPLGVG